MSEHHFDAYHVTPFNTYIKVFVTLVVLTVITVAAARVDFGWANPIIAFGIASVKAFFVLSYFMHLKHDSILNKAVMLTGFFFLLLLFAICAIDIATRIPVESIL